MKKWLAIANQLDSINKVAALVARWSVLLMLSLGLWNVVGRYLGVAIGFNLSSNRLIEGQWYLFDMVFLLGLGWTLQQNGHVRVDVLQGRWGRKRKAKIEFLGTLLLLLPFALGVAAIAIKPTINSWYIFEASPDPDGLPRYLIKTLIPTGFLLLAIQGISEAIRNWSTIKSSSLTHPTKRAQEKNLD